MHGFEISMIGKCTCHEYMTFSLNYHAPGQTVAVKSLEIAIFATIHSDLGKIFPQGNNPLKCQNKRFSADSGATFMSSFTWHYDWLL